jgi:phytoene synthase
MTAALDQAYAHCASIAYGHYENFPVASYLLPRHMRRHVAAVYAFARTADDFADQPHRPPEERERLLANWRAQLHQAVRGERTDDPIFLALANTMRERDLPVRYFEDLLSAFAQDVRVHRYASWADLFSYCQRSANPVGRLVLRIAGVRNLDAELASDAVCTALQLTNFWQDLGTDWHNGRLYVPQQELAAAGAAERDLDTERMTPQWRDVMRACVNRTRELFEEGRPVADAVDGRLRYELRATWLGGWRLLRKIEALDYDTLRTRPALSAADALALLPGVLLWKNRRTSHVARST